MSAAQAEAAGSTDLPAFGKIQVIYLRTNEGEWQRE